MTAKGEKYLLIIEDDDLQFEIYQEALEGFVLHRAVTIREALERISECPASLVILDHILADGDLGLEHLATIKEALPHVPIIVISGALEVHQQMEALQGPRRAHYCLTKPLDLEKLTITVQEALTQCGETEIVEQFSALEKSKRIDALDLMSRSTERLSRQNEILKRLQGRSQKPNISHLAREFRVARRTILRDLNELVRRGQLNTSILIDQEDSGVE
ncbi:MAG: response regulator [Verrucomicrobia bacterium]|nr:response regulator [Verrucomicrobiota bacterium]